MARHLDIMVIVIVGTILLDQQSQVASNPLPAARPTPFHKALFPPHHHKLVSPNYPHLLNKNQPNFYPFHQQYLSLQPNFGYHYPHPHQAYFGYPSAAENFEEILLNTHGSRQACPPAANLNPCSCFIKRVPFSAPTSTIICPEGLTPETAHTIFGGIRGGFDINSVELSLPVEADVDDYIPTSFKIHNSATAINALYLTATRDPARKSTTTTSTTTTTTTSPLPRP